MQNIRSISGSKALLVASSAGQAEGLARELAPFFDLITFASEDSFVAGAAMYDLVPFPEDVEMPYINYIGVVGSKDE